jgi:hypothetical protein
MRKKDYLKIQAGIKEAFDSINSGVHNGETKNKAIKGVQITAVCVAYQLALENPKFDKSKFLAPFGLEV